MESTSIEKTLLRLPSMVDDQLDLAAINQQLREKSAVLDWSGVASVPEKYLEVLFKNLDRTKNADELGIDGDMSDTVAADLQRFFRKQESKSKTELADLLKPPTPFSVRKELEEIIYKDLLGPAGGEQEEFDESSVSDRYLVGQLAPQKRRGKGGAEIVEEDLDSFTEEGEEGKFEPSATSNKSLFPSSVGFTCSIDASASAIKMRARYGKYTRGKSENFLSPKTQQPKTVWQREQIDKKFDNIRLTENREEKFTVYTGDYGEVQLRLRIRRYNPDGDWYVSAFLVNAQEEPKQGNRDQAWVFQPEISIESAGGKKDIFRKKMRHHQYDEIDPARQAEMREMSMLYRKQVEFAAGHGISVHAETVSGNPCRAVRLSTCVIPKYEVRKVTPPTAEEVPLLKSLVLDMKELAETATADFGAKLGGIADAYDAWIENIQVPRLDKADEDLESFLPQAKENLDKCRATLLRIREGLRVIQTNEQAAEAFRFMNRAMWQQRVHSILAEGRRRDVEGLTLESIDENPRNHSWFPFQLTFILINLPSLADLGHPDRSTNDAAEADLLWFPTGGGKTEAYLGLTAFTLGIRRLQGIVEGHDGGAGVAVLMRYTLRLLTLQQFQRAATLVCACEEIRRADPAKWGNYPFRLGLWVGSKTTPNKTEQSAESIRQAHGDYNPGSVSVGSPHQLTNCPWCGSEINKSRNIKVDTGGLRRTFVYCGDALGDCLFTERRSPNEGIPALLVDEEIYRLLPALLISTVDKFADMPWRGEVQMLFGRVDKLCERHGYRSPEIDDADSHQRQGNLPAAKSHEHMPLRPPDLIIQDELHLISGPLGTMVGLYETAIDQLCTWQVAGQLVRPKVIASTATIKQASDQIYKLFLRRANIFPPNGLDVNNNFFAVQREPSEENPGRIYLGICAPGRRLKVSLIRVYVALLAGAQHLFEKYGEHADAYMTLVGYFSSLRELGGMRRIAGDDISAILHRTARRGLANRFVNNIEELTSRKSATDIPDILDRLEQKFFPVPADEKIQKQESVKNKKRRAPIDMILATNMLSVGVDVPRLGAMVVAGQPKATAEYIQATSRVGRKHPGLVLTVYNWSRPRDLSHYEQFEHYHASFYQHVESLSLTPFSAGAMERGLSALLVALIRLSSFDLNKNLQAGALDRDHPLVARAVETIINRAAMIGNARIAANVEKELSSRLDFWLERINDLSGGARLGYQKKKDELTVGLLREAGAGRWERFTCLRSLRNVEPQVNLIMPEYGFIADDQSKQYQPFNDGD
jgi:hypothetical protein